MKDRFNSLMVVLAPKSVYGGWLLRQQPREAIKTALAHVFVLALLVYLGFLFFKIVWLIINALLSLAFGVPFEFPAAMLQTNS